MPRSRSPALTGEDLVAGARVFLRERLARREDAFLDLVHRAVFGNPSSPCRALLAHAGCEAGDLTGWAGARASRARWLARALRACT